MNKVQLYGDNLRCTIMRRVLLSLTHIRNKWKTQIIYITHTLSNTMYFADIYGASNPYSC